MSEKFNTNVVKLAQQTERKYGVPASVTLAQYALESGYGSSGLATRANNYFGITGTYNGNYVYSGGRKWRKYSSMEESFNDHGKLLSSGRYASATAGVTSAGQYVDAIAEIYAPSSDGNNNYAGKLKQIIQENNLTQYDNSMTVSAGFGNELQTLDVSGGSYATQTGWKDKVNSALETVIRIICYVFLVVLAIVFFMNAFEISPVKTVANTAVKKATGGAVDAEQVVALAGEVLQ